MKAQTQNEQILASLKRGAVIDPENARICFGTTRLAARIFELKQKGHQINTIKESFKSRSGKVGYIARYWLPKT